MSVWNKGLTKETNEGVRKQSEKIKGRKFTEEHKRKISIANKGQVPWCKGLTKEKDERVKKRAEKITGNGNPMFGKKHSLETRMRMGKVAKGRPSHRRGCKLSKETIEKIRKAKLGKPSKNRGKKRPELTGKNNGRYGIPPPVSSSRGIRSEIINPEGKVIWARSTWEAIVAKWLSLKGIHWMYEPETFALYTCDGRELTYTPDFFTDHFIEVKGWWTDIARKKVKLFKEQYPEQKLEIIEGERFKQIKWELTNTEKISR